MSARRAARLAEVVAKVSVPVLAVGLAGYVLVEPPKQLARAAVHHQPTAVPLESTALVCPGPETVGVRGADADHPATPPSPAQVAAAAPPDTVRPAGVGGAGGRVVIGRGADAVAVDRSGTAALLAQASTSAAASVPVTAVEAAAPGLVAEQLTVTRRGDERGAASATCLAASDDQWLVGGGTDVGRRGRLVLANPHDASADVTVDVLSTQGAVARTPGSTVAVPPHSRVVLLLDALAAKATSPVVHVRSTGGSVTAVLSDTYLDGTTPRGIDDVVAAMPPARQALVPGVRVDGRAVLRLAVPGDAEAVVQVSALGRSGATDLPDGGVVRVPAGTTRDVSLDSLPKGDYGLKVVSDVPVVAGAWVERRAGGIGEFAWSATSGPVTSLAGVARADVSGGRTDIVLTAPRQDAHVDVVTVAADGTATTREVDVAAGTTQAVQVSGSVWVRPKQGSGEVVAARFTQYDDAAGPLVTTGPLRQVALTRVPTDLAPADR
ncbi:DUF5719 family protein [Angustibacter sp. Root456]|uniref:DUF5719 family protein n=1 Tax=Angustibacter sp. Root456 TaxID=1736539 RepID=UPI0006FEC37F|nr:DUF5719 family protein [Angustibacter sp. Root456]KQX69899.1 hypothetical protein ASD06_02525 [Angustibacter sp. Root456]